MKLELSDDALSLGEEFETAVIGLARRADRIVLVYSSERVIDILMAGGIESEEEAQEFFEFNVTGAYHGSGTPYFCYDSWSY